jgi:hypothetical protein
VYPIDEGLGVRYILYTCMHVLPLQSSVTCSQCVPHLLTPAPQRHVFCFLPLVTHPCSLFVDASLSERVSHLLTPAVIVSSILAVWRVFSGLLSEAWPEKFTPGQRDLLPRFSHFPGATPGAYQGVKFPKYEPGVIKGQ